MRVYVCSSVFGLVACCSCVDFAVWLVASLFFSFYVWLSGTAGPLYHRICF